MKPFLLQFAETPPSDGVDLSIVEYSPTLHLNVIKGTARAAIMSEMLITQTLTKANEDVTDADRSLSKPLLQAMLVTSTDTYTATEQSDSDR